MPTCKPCRVDERVHWILAGPRLAHSRLVFALLLGSPWSPAPQLSTQLEAPLPSSIEAANCADPGNPVAGRDEDLRDFLGLLGAWREGDPSAAAPLRALAEHLCLEHQRCDVRAVARYYLALDPDQRLAGLDDEEEFYALRREVVEAGEQGMEPELWAQHGEELIAQLVALAESVRRKADFAPAARALALSARLELEMAESEARGGLEQARGTSARLADAARHSQEATRLFERAGQLTPRLEPLWVQARIERAAGRHRSARALFLDCLELARGVDREDYCVHALFGLVGLARDAGDVHEVDRRLGEISSLTSPQECWPLAREHAARLLHTDQAEAALGFLRRYPPSEFAYEDEWYGLIASSQLRLGNIEAARRAIDSMEEPDSGELARLAIASIDLADGHPQAVVDALGAPGALDGWTFQGQAQACSLLGEACLIADRVDLALDWLMASLERAEVWAALRADQSGGSVFGEWIGLHTVVLLAEAHARAGDALEAARVIENYQARTLRDEDLTQADVMAWAAHFERGLLSWCVGADRTIAVHVNQKGRATSHRLERGRAELEQAVRRLRESSIGVLDEVRELLASELSEVLFPPALRAAVAGSTADERLLLLLHGPLERAPLALLKIDGVALDELCTPLVLPGLPSGAPGDPEADDNAWYLLGAPNAEGEGGLRTARLPGASRELELLADLRPGAGLASGRSFDAQVMEQALSSGASLHVATHLLPAPDCEAEFLAPVGLLLADDEVFCAERVRQIEPHSPLVVLSTCESAGGRFVDAEGLHGLSRAFLAGSRNLLVTLWPVEDQAASRASVVFHEALLTGKSPSRAARELRLQLRAEGYQASEWGAYRLAGRD